ncbi:MAG: hypothetical protein HWN51_04590 [Desulfobacterales bacterium]|nr:hypothetical protein [Desulfobacterales bacterium]
MLCSKGIIIVALCLPVCLLVIGCGTTKKITDDILGKGRSLKKKIAFLPSVNRSGYGGGDFQKAARAQLKTFLSRRCDGLLVMDSRKTRKLLEEIPRLPSGQIDSLALATLGRIHGLHAVLEQSIAQIKCVTDKRGIWGFRNTCMLAQLSFRVRAYDVETTAILFDQVVQDAVEISEDDCQKVKTGSEYSKEIAHRLLGKIIPEIGQRIYRRLAEEPWKGYITAASENTLNLTAGKDVGLAAGDVFEVFAIGEPIKGEAGQVYLILGPKIGEIKVTKVHGDRAEAIGILGSNLEKSSCVKLKH